MRKLLLMISSLMLLMVGSLPAFAQTEDWSVILFDGSTNRLIKVDADGTGTPIDLGLDANTFANEFTFSPDGGLVAFCANRPPMGADQSAIWKLVVRDLANESTVYEQEFTDNQGCRASAFNADASLLAYGVVNYLPWDENIDSTIPAWELRLIDLSGNVVDSLNSNSPGVAELNLDEQFPVMPDVDDFGADELTVAAYPWVGMGGISDLPGFVWTLADDSVMLAPDYVGRFNDDRLPTGETVWSTLDQTIASAEPSGPVPQANVVRVADANGDVRTIYQNTEFVIISTTFVNNGQDVLVQLLEAFDPNNQQQIYGSRFDLVSRDGTVTPLDERYTSFTQGVAVPDGFVIVWAEHDPTQSEPPISHVDDYSSGTAERIYTYDIPDGSQLITILTPAWATPSTIPTDLPPFTAIN
ncbi:MAG: hypothetical protein RLP44_23340 [Aggregatilineales bacterium]